MREIKIRYTVINGNSTFVETFTLSDIQNGYVTSWMKNNRCIAGCKIHKDQYTGLTDKNGVEIYEGDVVEQFKGKDWSQVMSVEFNQSRCGFWLCLEKGVYHVDLSGFRESLEVIGNIHEGE